MESRLRRLYPAMLAVLGLLLFFPGLSAFGLWDPYEIRIADAARTLAHGAWTWGPQLGRPPAPVWLVALGFKAMKVGELGGRLPIAITALVTLLATYYAGAALVGRRAALFGSAALATTVGFLLGARQLTSDSLPMLGYILTVGGLARAAWPEEGTSVGARAIDLCLALAGMAIAQASSGMLVSTLPAVLAVTLAFAASRGTRNTGVALGVFSIVLASQALWSWRHATAYSAVLGGTPHVLMHTASTATELVRVGFAMFPWIALAPMAFAQAFDDGADRKRFGRLVLVAAIIIGYVGATFYVAGFQEVRAPIAPAVMLLVGAYLDSVVDDKQLLPFAGLVIALGALILGRDFFVAPEQLVGVHILESVRWPGPLQHVPYVIMAFGAFFAGAMLLGLGIPLGNPNGRKIVLGAGALSVLALSLTLVHWVIPQVSHHLSAREIYGKTKQLDPNAPLGQYRFNATGASYYASGSAPVNLPSVQELFKFLDKPERVFVMAGSDELPNIDQTARTEKKSYFVIDDSNSRYLVLSNRLGQNEKDLNPLKRFISEQAPKPEHPVEADFEGKVKLLGYDLQPNELARGQEFKIRLYFQVLQPLGGSYKIFLHFDGPGSRFNGDHVPLEGRFPTPNWVPGYYITDEHFMQPDRATQPAGFYRVYMGMFSGEARLKVTSGPQDGENRVKLGNVNIK